MKTKLARLWWSLLTIRFLFTILLTGMIALFGWYAVGEFLRWVADDSTLRVLFVGSETAWVGYVYRTVFVVVGSIFGFAIGGAIFRRIELAGESLRKMDTRSKLALILGIIVGLVLGAVLSLPIILIITPKVIAIVVALLLTIASTYLTTIASRSMKDEIHFYSPPAAEEEQLPKERYKILDTNVIIDGRVADIARTGFLDGPIYVPGFVLDELQHIADSADGLKRKRGRRGLEILDTLKKEQQTLIVSSYDRLVPDAEAVDARLVRLAKALNGSLVTNDWNLNRVAELQGVPVLNINELSNAIKPVILPGEDMEVQIVKAGNSPGQGVGYLDDGTMIVVADGRNRIGETVGVRVTTLNQTVQGKMIFAQLLSDEDNGEDDIEGGYNGSDGNGYGGGLRVSPRGGPRRPVRR